MPEFNVNSFCGTTVTSSQAGGSGTSTVQAHVVLTAQRNRGKRS